ncbi:hypothetical protein FHS18_006949 [Paenibacillus phyllosphaerae]|uniref:DinB-like domain-containing protein n=1 Tax=Paenibacillus phyllosphaerae TaxID=274593 RepID=A0A7W5B5Z0_9BACL|nr:DinB family protein [Paenibacillus phyllosphaerae]MBB3114789.1 hypothetical protein [Paenibacillus phyllosphaerae]
MLTKPDRNEYNEFFARYIDLVPGDNLLDMLVNNEKQVKALLNEITEEQGKYRYAEGKWSLKEVIGHITENERIQTYRLLRISRGDQTLLPGYDQDVIMKDAPYDGWTNAQVLEDYLAVRQATYTLIRGIPDDHWIRVGNATNSALSARAFAYMLAGHEQHHLNVLRERYNV